MAGLMAKKNNKLSKIVKFMILDDIVLGAFGGRRFHRVGDTNEPFY